MTGAARFLWFFRMGERKSSEKIVRKWIWKNEGAERREEKGGALRWEAGKMREELKKRYWTTAENEKMRREPKKKALAYGGE